MFIVTNRIKLKEGFAAKMAPMFTRPGALQSMKGFVKVEAVSTQNLEGYDELNVNMYWENLEDFHAWKASDAFKQAHSGPQSNGGGDSPIIESAIIIAKIESSIEA